MQLNDEIALLREMDKRRRKNSWEEMKKSKGSIPALVLVALMLIFVLGLVLMVGLSSPTGSLFDAFGGLEIQIGRAHV